MKPDVSPPREPISRREIEAGVLGYLAGRGQLGALVAAVVITTVLVIGLGLSAAGPTGLHHLWWPVAGVLVVHIVRSWRPVILHPWARAVGGVALLILFGALAPPSLIPLAFLTLAGSTLARAGLRLHTRHTARLDR